MGFNPTRLTLHVGARQRELEGKWAQRLWGSQGTRSSWSLTGAPKESEVQPRRDGFIGGVTDSLHRSEGTGPSGNMDRDAGGGRTMWDRAQ